MSQELPKVVREPVSAKKRDWKRSVIETSLDPDEVERRLGAVSSNLGPAYSSAKFFGSVTNRTLNVTLSRSTFSIGPAAPTLAGTIEAGTDGSIIRLEPAINWLSKSMVIIFLLLASVAFILTILTVISLRRWENEMLIGIGAVCFGAFGAMNFTWGADSLAAPSDWKRLQTAIAETVDGSIVS